MSVYHTVTPAPASVSSSTAIDVVVVARKGIAEYGVDSAVCLSICAQRTVTLLEFVAWILQLIAFPMSLSKVKRRGSVVSFGRRYIKMSTARI